jgi:hypothetical protein
LIDQLFPLNIAFLLDAYRSATATGP